MAESNNVKNLLGVSIEKIREAVDAGTVIGDPITAPNGTTVIPVSKVSYGFASGGSDLPAKNADSLFGGGAGAGINITPIAFLVITEGNVRVMPIVSKPDNADRVVSMVPDLVETVSGLFNRKKDKKRAEEAKEAVEEALDDIADDTL